MLGVFTAQFEGRSLMKSRYAGRFVGLDLHRRRTVIATEGGKVLEDVRIVNDVERFAYFSA
jgi:hypothetical protein